MFDPQPSAVLKIHSQRDCQHGPHVEGDVYLLAFDVTEECVEQKFRLLADGSRVADIASLVVVTDLCGADRLGVDVALR